MYHPLVKSSRNAHSAHVRGDVSRVSVSRALLLVILAVLVLALSSCQAPAQGVPGGKTPYVVTGTVTNSAGVPLANVEVFADNTLFYNSNILGYTGAAGTYSLGLPTNVPGTWNVGGYVRTTYHGETFDLRLHPVTNQAVVASEGGVRDLEWRLTGPVPEGDYSYGQDVYAYEYGFEFELDDIDDVEFTFTPLEPLIDGSTIEPFTRQPEGSLIADVPLGFYRVTARYVPDGETPTDLVITVRFDDSPAAYADAYFKSGSAYGMELEVGLP